MKNNLPLIIGAFILVIGAALWFSQKPTEVPASVAPLASTTIPSIPDTTSTPSAPSPPSPMPQIPAGVSVTNQTVLKVYNNPTWDISFKYEPDAKFTDSTNAQGEVEQVSLSYDKGTVLVSKDTPIAEPSLLTYVTSTRTIAGQQVEVRTSINPNEKYAYYIYFTVLAGNEEYHFSLKSYDDSREHTDDFIKRIGVK